MPTVKEIQVIATKTKNTILGNLGANMRIEVKARADKMGNDVCVAFDSEDRSEYTFFHTYVEKEEDMPAACETLGKEILAAILKHAPDKVIS